MSRNLYYVHLAKTPALKVMSQNYFNLCLVRSVLISVKYRNCCRTLGVYLLLVIMLGQIKSQLNYILVTYKLAVHELQICKSVLIEFAPSKLQRVNKHPKFNDNFDI